MLYNETWIERYLSERRQFFKKLDYLPVHLGVGAGLLSVTYAYLLGLELSPWVFVVSASAMFGIYAVNNKFDLEEDLVNKEHVTPSLAKISYYGGVASLVVSYVVSLAVQPLMAASVTFLLVSVLLYSVKISSDLKFQRIKDVPVLKNLFVAGVWGIFCLAVPMAFSNVFVMSPAIPLFSLTFAHLTVMTVIPDLRDIKGDRKAGVITLPTIYGRSGVMKFNIGITLLGLSGYLMGVSSGLIPSNGLPGTLVSLTSVLPILATDEKSATEMTQIHELNFLFGFPALVWLMVYI